MRPFVHLAHPLAAGAVQGVQQVIGWLRGNIVELVPSLVVLDVQGVGYEVHIPLTTFYEMQKVPEGREATLRIHTHVREDALQLFGFATLRERQLFEKLIAVSGIGPKLAQTILSGMGADDLVSALSAGDVRRLTTIPGVGKKTAERMVLELRDKVKDLATATSEHRVAASPSEESDLVLALINLGYKRAAVDRAVIKVGRDLPDAPLADQLKACLGILSRV